MIISLVGFMGTGKTSVGKILARKLNFNFLDTDRVIEEKTGFTINKIFSFHGEKYFRLLESEVLKQILEQNNELVLSTGGGIVLARKNREKLKQDSFPILLWASVDEIYQRTLNSSRPLLQGEEPRKKIKQLLEERKEYYFQFNPQINTDGKTPTEVANEVLKCFKGVDS